MKTEAIQAESEPGPAYAGYPLSCLIVMPLAEQRGGSELALLHLIEHSRDLGIRWTVVFFEDGSMVKAVREWGVKSYVIPSGRLRQPYRMAMAIWRLARVARRVRADVVLSWMGKGQIYGGAAAVLARVPAMWFQHGLPDPVGWQDRLATALPARRVITCSNAGAAAQNKVWPGRSTVTVNPGVDLSLFDATALPAPMDCRRKLGLPLDGPLIGMVARLQRWKGVHHLIEAMPELIRVHPEIHAVIVGGSHALEPDYPAILEKRIAALGLRDRVTMCGLQSNVREWIQAMDVVVHASDAEPFGMVIIEAMALGKPVVATATAGPSEIIEDRVNGRLWLATEPARLVQVLVECLDHPESTRMMAAAARGRAETFSVKRYAAGVAGAIHTVVNEARSTSYV